MGTLERRELQHGDGRRLWLYGPDLGQGLPPDAPGGAWPALHLRHDPLRDRWVAISPARNTRPQSAPSTTDPTPACPLCVGGPELPFAYDAAVFENRFPSLLADPPAPPELEGATAPSVGRCEVVMYTSTHTGSLATLTADELAQVVAIWCDRSEELWADERIEAVLAFENRGEDVGATLSHPHGQIYAFGHLPPHLRERVDAATRHRARHDSCLYCEVVERDAAATGRIVVENPSFVVSTPFAPDWPYEIHVRARRHGTRRLPDLTPEERRDLAVALREVVRVYDRLFEQPMAYLMACQQAPRDGSSPVEDWHLSFEFLPPSRGPDKLKMRASVETAAGLFINDTDPEVTAAELRDIADRTRPAELPEIPLLEVVRLAPERPDALAGRGR
jgi:UDPglucose--hexose-1-phosphate uridylyltransferase